MIVAASSESLNHLSTPDMIEKLVDLQFTSFELAVHETGGHLKPTEVLADFGHAVDICRATKRLALVALNIDIEAEGPEFFEQFTACCKLAKAVKVVPLVVRASELGTPFNAEVERLREMVGIAAVEGVLVAVKTESGRVTQDAGTCKVMCDHVKGLGLTLDPSHFIYGTEKPGSFEEILPFVYHVHLRDTTPDELQVRVGQGQIEYGRLVSQLTQQKYDRALCVNIQPIEGIDHDGELRKLRLLLESLLI